MFCGRCGSRQDDDARYCTSCGNPLLSGAEQAARARRDAGGKRFFPANAGSRAVWAVLLFAVAVAFASAAVLLAFVWHGSSVPGPSPAGDAESGMRAFGAPAPETGTPLYTVLTLQKWELCGYADNPGQGGGPSKDFGSDSFGGNRIIYAFSADGSTATKTVEYPDRRIRQETSSYEIVSQNCCDVYSEDDGGYWRFCLATDGNMYAAITTDAGPQSDYAVFRPVSP